MTLYKKNKKSNGIILAIALILIFLTRFTIEFYKENQVGFENSMALNMVQLLSIPFIIIGMVLLLIKKKNSEHQVV